MRKAGIIITLALLMGACQQEKTRYNVSYIIDNTEMNTQSLAVYECDSEGLANGRWLSDHHHYDTISIGEGTHVMASGCVEGVAREGCTQLVVIAENMDGTNMWNLDTVFVLKLNGNNSFTINSDMHWIKHE